MRVDSVRIEGPELVLTVPDRRAAMRVAYDFKPGEYELRRTRKKRSLDANAYMWALCGKIGEALNIPPEEVYKHSVSEGSAFYPMPIREDAVEHFARVWAEKGIAWFVVVIDDSRKLPGYKLVHAYYGSSVYDTKEMSHLIDRVVEDARALDIETLSERELSLLKDNWHAQED